MITVLYWVDSRFTPHLVPLRPRDLGLGQDNAMEPIVGLSGDDVVNETNFLFFSVWNYLGIHSVFRCALLRS